MEFYIEGLSLSFYMMGPCEFVVEVKSEVTSDFSLGNSIVVETYSYL